MGTSQILHLKSCFTLENQGSVPIGSESPAVRFTSLHSVPATIGFSLPGFVQGTH